MNLLRTILSSVWMIDATTLRASAPLVVRLMKGESVSFQDGEKDVRPFALWQRSNVRYYNYNDAPPGSVAVHPIIGTITKYDQYCGPSGTETLMKEMSKADNHKNIGAHLMEIESGGGEATNIETVARFIKNEIKKPVIAWYNGVAASAAYYIAAAADEIYASEDTDMVGSIGTLISFADFTQFFEEQGIKIHEVYADQSSLKNLDFKKALEGDYDLLKKNLLNPYAQAFIDTVKEFRPQITKSEVYKGEIYLTKDAINIGLIDGKKTWEEASGRALMLAQNFHNQNTANMSIKKINALLGYDIEIHNGGAFLQATELDMIGKNLTINAETSTEETGEVAAGDASDETSSTQATETSSTETTTNETTTSEATEEVTNGNSSDGITAEQLTAVIGKALQPVTKRLDTMEAKIKVIGGEPGAQMTKGPSNGDANEPINGEPDALAQLNAASDEARKSNGQLHIN